MAQNGILKQNISLPPSSGYSWHQHPPCTEEQAEWLIQSYRRRGREVKKDLSLDYRHWIISVRLPFSERPPRPSRTFQQRIWR